MDQRTVRPLPIARSSFDSYHWNISCCTEWATVDFFFVFDLQCSQVNKFKFRLDPLTATDLYHLNVIMLNEIDKTAADNSGNDSDNGER